MKVPHVFEIEERTDSPCSKRWYTPIITPGCEWVLEGKGEACRLYDGPFVRVGEEKATGLLDSELDYQGPISFQDIVDFFLIIKKSCPWHGILWRREVECDRCDEGAAFFCHRCNEDKQCEGITCPSCGLELDCHTCDHCHGTGRITQYAKIERRLLP